MDRIDLTKLTGDYHVHSVYSSSGHGKGSVTDIAEKAHELGLKEVCITDHGMSHPFYGVKKGKLQQLKEDIIKAHKLFPDVNVYHGMETNFISSEGFIDSAEAHEMLDVLTMGFHKIIIPMDMTEFFRLTLSNFVSKKSSSVIKRNTDMYIKALEKYPVDVISHPLRDCLIDLKEVGTAAAEKGTLIELNGKKTDMTPSDVLMLAGTGCRFILGSDAHSPSRIGDVVKGLKVFAESGADISLLSNYGKLPVFRSGKIKRG